MVSQLNSLCEQEAQKSVAIIKAADGVVSKSSHNTGKIRRKQFASHYLDQNLIFSNVEETEGRLWRAGHK